MTEASRSTLTGDAHGTLARLADLAPIVGAVLLAACSAPPAASGPDADAATDAAQAHDVSTDVGMDAWAADVGPANQCSRGGPVTDPLDQALVFAVASRCRRDNAGAEPATIDCIVSATGIGAGCATCFAGFATCVAEHCPTECSSDAGGDCSACGWTHCGPAIAYCGGDA